jgi:hypothetical protein
MRKRIPVKAYAPPGTPCCCGSGRISTLLRDAVLAARKREEELQSRDAEPAVVDDSPAETQA